MGVWKEGGKNATAVGAGVKTLARWIKGRLKNGNGMPNARQIMIGVANKWVYDRFKNRTWVGGDVFNNNAQPDNNRLPTAVTYTEWDVQEYTGAGRGAERIVIGSDHKMYYTGNHYADFTEFT
jgi:ribonuclease